MATTNPTESPPPWLVSELIDDVAERDASRIARRIGGIMANDGRILETIQAALDDSGEADDNARCHRVLNALAAELTRPAVSAEIPA